MCELIMEFGAFAGVSFYLEITEFLCQDFCLRPLFIKYPRCACGPYLSSTRVVPVIVEISKEEEAEETEVSGEGIKE